MGKLQKANATRYEQNQSFNSIVRWLHSFRYKNILQVFEDLTRSLPEGRTIRVVDVGCAHAKLFDILKDRFRIDYIGIEVDQGLLRAATERHGGAPNFTVIHGEAEHELGKLSCVDVVVALEVLEHIPEHSVVRIVEQVARLNPRLFVCSVPVEIGPAIWIKNVGSLLMGYNRHREYTWAETLWAGFGQLDKLPPHGVGHKGFDWRWLAQTVRHNHIVTALKKFPFNALPAGLSTSVFILAEPRPPQRQASDSLPPLRGGESLVQSKPAN